MPLPNLNSALNPIVSVDYESTQILDDLWSPREGGSAVAFSDALAAWALLPLVSLLSLVILSLDWTISLATVCSQSLGDETASQTGAGIR